MVLDFRLPLAHFGTAHRSAADLEGNPHLFLIAQKHHVLPFSVFWKEGAAKFSTYAMLHMLKGFDCKLPVLYISKYKRKNRCNHNLNNIAWYNQSKNFYLFLGIGHKEKYQSLQGQASEFSEIEIKGL